MQFLNIFEQHSEGEGQILEAVLATIGVYDINVSDLNSEPIFLETHFYSVLDSGSVLVVLLWCGLISAHAKDNVAPERNA